MVCGLSETDGLMAGYGRIAIRIPMDRVDRKCDLISLNTALLQFSCFDAAERVGFENEEKGIGFQCFCAGCIVADGVCICHCGQRRG